jgi:SNF2 family DNA or RNA helicase
LSPTTDAVQEVADFKLGNVKRVLVISYDQLRRHISVLKTCPDINLLICDEGHRLKNADGNQTIDALNSLAARKRVILSGTPIQNDLEEFWAMVSFVKPGVLGTLKQFRKLFAEPIMQSRDLTCSSDRKRVGRKKMQV